MSERALSLNDVIHDALIEITSDYRWVDEATDRVEKAVRAEFHVMRPLDPERPTVYPDILP